MKNERLIIALSLAMIVLGLLIHYIVAKRRFNRKAITGLQQFKSFEESRIISFIEKLGTIIASILILTGIALLAISKS